MSETTVAPTIITKMSVKAVGCNPRKAAALDEGSKEVIRLCHVYGTADGIKHGEDGTGKIWSCLTGTFEAINLDSHAVYQSGKLFLPGGIHESVESPLRALQEKDKSASVQFAFELRAVKATNPVGYSYQAVALMKPAENDPLAILRGEIMERENKMIEAAMTPEPALIEAPPDARVEAPPAARVEAPPTEPKKSTKK